MELSVYLRPLRRWWWLLLASTALAAASSVWYVGQQPPLYRAMTTLMIGRAFEDPNPKGTELALGQQLAETYADLAQRRPVREQTMAALGLTSLPAYSARPLPNRPLLEISVVDTDPQRAKAVADELANQLIQQSPTAPKPEEQERLVFIDDQLVSLQAHIQETEAEIAAKRVELESATGALEIRDLQTGIAALQTKLSTLQSNYAALLASTKDGANNTVEIIEPATLPSRPTDSGKAQTVLAASAVALALAVCTAYLLDYLDDRVRTADDLSRIGGPTRLPGIPMFQEDGGRVPVLTQAAPGSQVTEAFRALRTGLQAATAGKPHNVLLVTSAAPREGKSVVAANLAAVLAQNEKRVVLIDADLRRPTQHELFDVPGAYGLADLLAALDEHGQANGWGEIVQHAIRKAGPERLGLIPAGSDLAGATALLGSDRMRALLEILAQRADYVILDSPPVLAVSDALMLSTQVDGVVLVTSVGSLPSTLLAESLRRLGDVNANVLGVVLNRQKPEADGHYHRYYRAQPKPN